MSSKTIRSPVSVVLTDPGSLNSNCSHDFHQASGHISEDVVGFSPPSQGDVTFGLPGSSLPVPASLSPTEFYYSQKDYIMALEQRIKDSEENLQREIALREHFEREAVYANDACDDFFNMTLQMSETITSTERHLELKFLAMQHTIAVWEAWGMQHGISIVKYSDDVAAVVAENSCTSD